MVVPVVVLAVVPVFVPAVVPVAVPVVVPVVVPAVVPVVVPVVVPAVVPVVVSAVEGPVVPYHLGLGPRTQCIRHRLLVSINSIFQIKVASLHSRWNDRPKHTCLYSIIKWRSKPPQNSTYIQI